MRNRGIGCDDKIKAAHDVESLGAGNPERVSRILRSPDFRERYEVVFQTIGSAALADLRKVR